MSETNLRPQLSTHLRQRLSAFEEGFRHNLAIIGPPGSGKTFQLQQLLGEHYSPVSLIYCPVYRESCRSFLYRFLCSLLQSALGSATGQTLEELLGQAQPNFPKTVAAIRAIDGLLGRRLFGEAFSRALDVVPIFVSERSRPCVLMLDEFLFLEELGLGHAFHELGKRVMTWPHTLFILASSSPYRARQILRERLQLLFGQFELITLEALEADNTAGWVESELEGLSGLPEIVPFLMSWLGAYPWYLSVFLRRLKESALLNQKTELTEALIHETAWDLLGRKEGMLHQWCSSRIERFAQGKRGSRAVETLIQVADGARTMTELSRRAGRAALSDTLQVLVENDLIQRRGSCWYVQDPVLRCWLSAIIAAQRTGSVVDARTLRLRFESHLAALWAAWLQTTRQSFTERVTRLFASFQDDTISLDSKTGRLPKFQSIRALATEMHGPETYLVAEGPGKRWCATVQEKIVDENAISRFDAFCRTQTPKPSRKVVVAKSGVDQNARLLAKAVNMWVWDPDELNVLLTLYGQP